MPGKHFDNAKFTLGLSLLILSLLLNACGTTSQSQQEAQQHKTILDQLINHAQLIGIPQTLLQPILNQEQALNTTSPPLSLFSNQSLNDYYMNISLRYQFLSLQVQGLEAQVTQQLNAQTNLDLQNFQNALVQRQNQGFFEAQTFADQLSQDQVLLNQAQYPKQFLEISRNARDSTTALQLMGPTNDQLSTFQHTIQQLANSGLDVTALQQQAQYDQEAFQTAASTADFQDLLDQIKAQLQASMTLSTQAIPYISTTKLHQLQTTIEQMKQFQIDTSAFQLRFDLDHSALIHARTINDYLQLSTQLDDDLNTTRIPLLKAQASSLLQQYYQEVNTWGAHHRYYDSTNGLSYRLDYEYDAQYGIGNMLDQTLLGAQTPDDYQTALDQIHLFLLHLKAMETNYNDHTIYTQPHVADLQLMQQHQLNTGTIVVVSLLEQALRVYQNDILVKAFLITTGQYERPTLPGFWQIFVRQSPMIFTSWDPKGSAFWYPNTNINYAMEYHQDGYYFHDSWWRNDYGPGTNFPHTDSSGNQTFSDNGSHGCINMPEAQARWLYQNTSYGTPVIIY